MPVNSEFQEMAFQKNIFKTQPKNIIYLHFQPKIQVFQMHFACFTLP